MNDIEQVVWSCLVDEHEYARLAKVIPDHKIKIIRKRPKGQLNIALSYSITSERKYDLPNVDRACEIIKNFMAEK